MMHVDEKMIADIFRYRKSKVWKKFGENQLVALVRRDGGTDYITLAGGMGIGIFREEEMYSFNIMQDIAEAQENFFGYDPDEGITAEHKTRIHMTSFLRIDFGSKKEFPPSWTQLVDHYKKKTGIRLYGNRSYFMIMKNIPRRVASDEISKEDLNRLSHALKLLNWLSNHPEWIRPFAPVDAPDGSSTQGVVLYKPLKDGSYDASLIYAPWTRQVPFEPVSFAYEVLVRQIRPLVSKSRDVMECNLFMIDTPVVEEGFKVPKGLTDPEKIKDHLIWPWIFMAGTPEDEQIFFMKGFQEADMEVLRQLAREMIDTRFAPREIRVTNEWTYLFLADFCKKTGIKLSQDHDLWIEDATEDFLDHMETRQGEENGEEQEEEDFHEAVRNISLLTDEEFKGLPQFIRDALRAAFPDLPKDLQERCVRLFKWKM